MSHYRLILSDYLRNLDAAEERAKNELQGDLRANIIKICFKIRTRLIRADVVLNETGKLTGRHIEEIDTLFDSMQWRSSAETMPPPA